MRKIKERRLFQRFPAGNLIAEIDGKLYDVEDISLGGLRLSGRAKSEERSLTFVLRPRDVPGEADNKGVQAKATVVACYDDATALKFENATMPLMKLVVQQASLELGVEPYAVK